MPIVFTDALDPGGLIEFHATLPLFSCASGTWYVVGTLHDANSGSRLRFAVPISVSESDCRPEVVNLSLFQTGKTRQPNFRIEGSGRVDVTANLIGLSSHAQKIHGSLAVELIQPDQKVVDSRVDSIDIAVPPNYSPGSAALPLSDYFSIGKNSPKGKYTLRYTLTDKWTQRSTLTNSSFIVK